MIQVTPTIASDPAATGSILIVSVDMTLLSLPQGLFQRLLEPMSHHLTVELVMAFLTEPR